MIFKITNIWFVLAISVFFVTTPLFAVKTLDELDVSGTKPVSGNELDQLLKNVENNFSKVETLRTLLTQDKNIALFSETIISTGLCLFKKTAQKPAKLRLDFITPFKSSLIINNNKVFKYEFFNGTWQKLDTGNQDMMLLIMGNITSWLQGRFKDPKLYDMKVFKNKNVYVVLTPKADEFKKFISSFELGVNLEMNGLDYIIIKETKNNYTKIKFHKDEINKEISDDIFDGSNDEPRSVLHW